MKDRVKDVFGQLATVYEHTVDTKSLYNSEYERPAMLKQLPYDLENRAILDAGCAAGWYTQQLILRGANVVATDISPEMVSSTKRRVGDRAQILCLDLEGDLPFDDNSFDFIVSSLTLHYMKDWSKTFSEFHRILRPKGIFLFTVHHPFTDIEILDDARYFSTELIIDKWNKEGKVYEVPFFRRPLQEIINKTATYFDINKMVEPQPTMNFKKQDPEVYERLMKRPQFLIIQAYVK